MLTAGKCLAQNSCLMNGSWSLFTIIYYIFPGSFRPYDIVIMLQRNSSIPLLFHFEKILDFS